MQKEVQVIDQGHMQQVQAVEQQQTRKVGREDEKLRLVTRQKFEQIPGDDAPNGLAARRTLK